MTIAGGLLGGFLAFSFSGCAGLRIGFVWLCFGLLLRLLISGRALSRLWLLRIWSAAAGLLGLGFVWVGSCLRLRGVGTRLGGLAFAWLAFRSGRLIGLRVVRPLTTFSHRFGFVWIGSGLTLGGLARVGFLL